MAQNFTNYTAAPYLGTLLPNNVGVCTPSKFDPRTVVATIDWSLYPTGAVLIDMTTNSSVVQSIDQIRSVKIDNTFRNSSVQLVFPDTRDDISCPNDSIATGFVLTYQLKVLVFSRRGGTGLTRVFFNNFLVDSDTFQNLPNSVDLWSSQIAANGDSTYNAPALGSFNGYILLSMLTNNTTVPLFGTPKLGTNVIITNIVATCLGVYSDTFGPKTCSVRLVANGAQSIYSWNFYAPNDLSFMNYQLPGRTAIQEALTGELPLTLSNFGDTCAGYVQFDFQYNMIPQPSS